MNPAIGKRMRTSRVVNATESGPHPGTSSSVSHGASRMPSRLKPAASASKVPRIEPASRRASSEASRASRPL